MILLPPEADRCGRLQSYPVASCINIHVACQAYMHKSPIFSSHFQNNPKHNKFTFAAKRESWSAASLYPAVDVERARSPGRRSCQGASVDSLCSTCQSPYHHHSQYIPFPQTSLNSDSAALSLQLTSNTTPRPSPLPHYLCAHYPFAGMVLGHSHRRHSLVSTYLEPKQQQPAMSHADIEN